METRVLKQHVLLSVLLAVLSLVMAGSSSFSLVQAEDACESVFSAAGRLYCFVPSRKALASFEVRNDELGAPTHLPVEGVVQQVAEIAGGILIATGYGRGEPRAPIRLLFFSADGSRPRKVFERETERAQVSFLRQTEGRVWITFFESKYETRTGYFEVNHTTPWAFKSVVAQRMGDVTEVLDKDTLLVGRPYGDTGGQDGDLQVYEGGARREVPSYRGVRAAVKAVMPHAAYVSDGWHQNYGQLAQARLNLLRFDQARHAYSLQLLAKDPSQYFFRKIFPVASGSKEIAVVVGNRKVSLVGPEPLWLQRDVYEVRGSDTVLDATLLPGTGNRLRIAVLDDSLHIVAVELP